MLILLPPSEGKTAPRRGSPLDLATLTFPALTGAREKVIDALENLCSGDQARAIRTLGLGKTQSAEIARNLDLREAPTARADRIYTGVLYDALEFATLSASAKRRATSWVLIASSVFGFLRPSDRIPAYRLSGDVPLPGIGTVSTYWNAQLDDAAAEALGSGVALDLRSSTYASFWRPSRELSNRVVSVRVLHEHQGARKVVSHFNKATKGRLVRQLLTEGSAVGSVRALREQLGDLGWEVEDGPKPGVLDVVVDEL
ncbi:MAG: peroxide stress protein YaaA [Nocardioidaceae bacterium]|nr:MAG: peroxide stress protein YaaA [Nocardioidaceae bacterium]